MSLYQDEPEFRVKRIPDISFTTSDTKVIARLQRQFAKGDPLSVNLQGWHGKAYVLKLAPHFSVDGLTTCDVTLRPTGRPCSRPDALRISANQVTFGPDRAYGKVIITGMPTPPAGTIAQRIYGVPMLQSALDKMREHIKVSTQRAIERASEDLLFFGADYGKSPSFTVVDDPLGPDPLGTPASRERIMHWYNDTLGRRHEFHPNCRCVPVGITSKEKKRMKVRNKFYVAAPSVTTESEQAQDNIEKNVHLATSPNDRSGKWTRKDLAAAIAHAQTVLENDPTKDHVAVVKIVKIVRRPKPKFIVEDVK